MSKVYPYTENDLMIKKPYVSVRFSKKVMGLLCVTPPHPKGAPKELKRLIRVRHNFFRELNAFNKELRRFNP